MRLIPFINDPVEGDGDERVQALEQLYSTADATRRKFEPDWYSNCLFLAGNQWEAAASDVRRFRKLAVQPPHSKVKIVSNQILPLARQAASVLRENLAQQVAIPSTSDRADIADNDIVYLYDSKDKLPMGLLGIVQDGVHYSGVAQSSTFQNLARADYSSLRSRIYQATDFGLPSENPADGVPTGWDLSVVSDAIADSWRGGGKGRVDMLLCSANLAMAIMRRNRSESNIVVNVSSTAKENQGAVGSMYANKFIAPDGRLIPIKVVETIPENCLYGLCLDDLNWYPFGDFDFVREYGEIWEPSRGDRKTNVEAPYGGFYNIGAERCDNCFVIQDMRTDI